MQFTRPTKPGQVTVPFHGSDDIPRHILANIFNQAGLRESMEMTDRYLVVYAKCQGSNFSGYSPDVDGCISTGQTLEEMRAMMKEGLTFHLEGTAEHGDPISEPHTTQVDFTDEDFEGVEYFVVEHMDVEVPSFINPVQRIPRHEPVNA